MNTYKKITIILFIIVMILGIRLYSVSNELKTLKENKNNIETKQDSLSNENKDKINSNEKNNSEEFKTIITDVSENSNGLSKKDNERVKNTVITFLQGYANYLDSEDISFENRMKHRVYNLKDIMTSKLYENVEAEVEFESMNIKDNYVYRYLKGVSIYEVEKEKDKVKIGVAVHSIYFDFAMDQEVMNEENGDFKTDFKFTLIKENGKWKIDEFQENYK